MTLSPVLTRFPRFIACIFASALTVLPPGTGHADQARSILDHVSSPFVDDGFTVRAAYWNGKVESSKQRLVRHQLFRGNEYWFWLATTVPGCKIHLEIYNAEGEPITVEKRQDALWAGARVTPAKTGSYYILLKIESLTEPALDWALVYGYR